MCCSRGGLLFEHTHGYHSIATALTDLLNPLWFCLNGSCRLNRRTAQTVAQAGFSVASIERHLGGVVQLICGH